MSLFALPHTEVHLVEFNAGKCIIDGNWIKPDLRKGKVYLDQGDDQLLHLYWKERKNQATPEDDLIIFPDEAEFTKVSQCTTGRVYLLRFKTSNERHFYWMQSKDEEKDQSLADKVNEIIRDPDTNMNSVSELDESTSHAELMRILNNVENQDPDATPENILQFLNNMNNSQSRSNNETSENQPTPTTVAPILEPNSQSSQSRSATERITVVNPSTESSVPKSSPVPESSSKVESSSTATNSAVDNQPSTSNFTDQASEQMKIMEQFLLRERERAAAAIQLSDVLNSKSVTPLLNDTKVCESLYPYLPDELEKTPEEVRQVIKSPQFSQALHSFGIALQTGQLGPLLSQLGLDYNAGSSVQSFVNAINEQAKKKKEDAMEED